MTTIAVIDSGISLPQPTAAVKREVMFCRKGERIDMSNGRGDDLGHGTACAAIINRLAPSAGLISVRIEAEGHVADADVLAAAISWCARERVDLVNVSLGVLSPTPKLREACARAAAAGTIIVAAEHNEGRVSYPAHLPTVIGVRGGRIFGDDTYHYCPDQPIECIARGDAQRVRWRRGGHVLIAGNSFAAPRIAGIVARLRTQQPGAHLETIRRLLRAGAARIVAAGPGDRTRPRAGATARFRDSIQRAALYPYTKEMHAFVRFRDLLPFRLVGAADPPGRGQAGRDAGEAIGAARSGLVVEPSVGAACRGADTLILGYLRQLGGLRGRDLHREHLEFALAEGLHVFSFEPVPPEAYGDLHDAAARRGLKIAWPRVSRRWAESLLAGAASDPVSVPVLAVVGTSASQGKFTLQLALRRRLLAAGHRLAQVGTEPHAELFGMDWAFPMGYGSTVDLCLDHYPLLVDRRLRQICADRQADLLVVGAQSGTVPFDVQDENTHSLPTLAFLLGARPDACVLVVNDVDPEDYIADTIAGLRSVLQTEVIGLAVSDRSRQVVERHGRRWAAGRAAGSEELAATVGRLEARFGLPAVCITDVAGIERLRSVIVGHFAAATERQEASCRPRRA